MTDMTSWIHQRPVTSRWRRRSRAVMRDVVSRHVMANGVLLSPPQLVADLVDAAYPFGARERYPYKAWLQERRALHDALFDRNSVREQMHPPPTIDDQAACDVALDLVEMGRTEEARAILDEQAPRRLNRDCPVCGAKVANECRNPDDGGLPRLVPHIARVAVHGALLGGAR